MKSFYFLIAILFLQLRAFAQTPTVNPNGPKFKFDTEVIDYGTIEHKGNGLREFKFTNVGKEPLIISDVKSSCGCLVPEWPKEPIKPGASSKIKARYDTQRVGNFEKTLTVNSNDSNRPSLVLKIKGKVLPPPAKDSIILIQTK